jgi:hypothetical protein
MNYNKHLKYDESSPHTHQSTHIAIKLPLAYKAEILLKLNGIFLMTKIRGLNSFTTWDFNCLNGKEEDSWDIKISDYKQTFNFEF